MNELGQERSRIHASILKGPLVSPQPARDTKRDMQEPALLNRRNMISVCRCLKTRRDLKESVATFGGEKSCVLSFLSEDNLSQVESLTCWICQKEFSCKACVIQHYEEHMRLK